MLERSECIYFDGVVEGRKDRDFDRVVEESNDSDVVLERRKSSEFNRVVEERKATIITSCWRGAKVEILSSR